MPTYERLPGFDKDYDGLSTDEKQAFRRAVAKFVEDLRKGEGLSGVRNGLRVKGIQGWDGVFEMTWAPDGRAAFSVGDSIHEGEPHIIWRAVGGHEIF